ncbi:MAG: hypothetical protein CM15mP55_0250 [Hyphomicrobiales bacterium]|nr:MAG: hypothetical protein CM15mP55_0250 [Hyphomicrobiales bacterium]
MALGRPLVTWFPLRPASAIAWAILAGRGQDLPQGGRETLAGRNGLATFFCDVCRPVGIFEGHTRGLGLRGQLLPVAGFFNAPGGTLLGWGGFSKRFRWEGGRPKPPQRNLLDELAGRAGPGQEKRTTAAPCA